MDWAKVADRLELDASAIAQNSHTAFPNDYVTQREMRSRATLMRDLATAIRDGLTSQQGT